MGDILKEAIADAKAVRATALANAKMALEEAFTPQLKSMLSAKLREEDEDFEDEAPVEDEEDFGGEEEESFEEGEDFEDEAPVEDEEDFGGEEEESFEEGEDFEDGAEFDGEDEEEGEELDLESIIKELESELSEDEDMDYEEDGDEEEFEVDESVFEEEEDFEVDESVFEEEEDFEAEDEDDFDIDESIFEEDDDETYNEDIEDIKTELKQYKEAINYMKDKLHEVNILNAKLLFTNKIFKEFVLNQNDKFRVVETFDRASTTREIKLVYTTLAESFKTGNSVKRKSIKESASAKSGSTKPTRKIITEEAKVANRFRELAGIKKIV